MHLLVGWMVAALVDASSIAIRITPRAAVATRAAVHFFAAFQVIAVGVLVTTAAWLLHRFAPRAARRWILIVALVAAALSYPILGDDVSGLASRLPFPRAVPLNVWIGLTAAVTSLLLPLVAWLGTLLARPWIRLAGVALGVAAAATNGHVHAQSYQGLHLLATAGAAALIGASLRGAAPIRRLVPTSRVARIAFVALLGVIAAASVLVTPANNVRQLMAREPSAVFAPFLGSARMRGAAHQIPSQQREWFTSRAALPPVPPSAPPILPKKPILLLIGIDSLRADVLADERNRALLPTLFELKSASTYFTRARSAGSSTVPSFAAIFSGVYYSQQYWTRMPESGEALPFPHLDPSPRVAEIMQEAGIRTASIQGLNWLQNRYAIVRGFDDELVKKPLPARTMIREVIQRLESVGDEPLFVFAHILDAHYPYTSAGKKRSPFQGYLAELAAVDREIGNLLEAIRDPRIRDRTCLIVMADHGEAFGEHGITTHSQNLYDVLLRVPLMIRLPEPRAQVVDEPVSLIDLGPTMLDLMGLPTPGTYMGQSLTGFLRGERPKLRRTIAAEARLKRMILTPDGFKVIHDPIAQTFEIFDLNSDPNEENNLYVDGSKGSLEKLGMLEAFTHANTYKRPGYKVPWRKW